MQRYPTEFKNQAAVNTGELLQERDPPEMARPPDLLRPNTLRSICGDQPSAGQGQSRRGVNERDRARAGLYFA